LRQYALVDLLVVAAFDADHLPHAVLERQLLACMHLPLAAER
jgi:hypothetical protein